MQLTQSPAAPALHLLVERQAPQRVVWIADGSGSLYAVPTLEQQLDIVEAVRADGRACRDCDYCERSGDGWHEPRTADCRVLAGDAAPSECEGYDDELVAWEQERLAEVGDEDFAALGQVAA